jgi:transglutaminase-like putative cysteine protease
MAATHDASSASSDRFPWSITLAGLIAMTALCLTTIKSDEPGVVQPPQAVLAALGILLVAARLTSLRLPQSRLLSWGLRIAGFVAVFLVVGVPDEAFYMWYIKPAYTIPLGCAVAVELTTRAWERRVPANRFEWRGVALLLTALVMLAACNTYDRTYVRLVAPFYVLAAVMSLRSFALLSDASQAAVVRPRRRPGLMALRATAVLAAMSVGFLGVEVITRFDTQIMRWGTSWLNPSKNRNAQPREIGLGGNPTLSSVFNPGQSMDRVLLIEGPRGERHLRAAAFDTYDNRTWKPDVKSRSFDPLPRVANASGVRLQFRRLTDTEDVLPLPLTTGAVSAKGGKLQREPLGTVKLVDTDIDAPYSALVSTAETFQGVAAVEPDPAARATLTRVPPSVSPAVSELARSVAGDGTPLEKVTRIAAHLRSNHAYSLQYQPGDGDPLSDFILNKRAAHCQYFASALVMMSRAVGVPARLVTGYYAHEPYGDDAMVVRSRDAHAWAECYLDGVGWVTMDATPSGGRPSGLFEPASSWQRLKEFFGDIPGAIRRWISEGGLRTVLVLLAVVGVLWAAIRLAIWVWRRRHPSGPAGRSYDVADPVLVQAGRRFEAWLRRRGVALSTERTWREQLASLGPDAGPAERFVDAWDAARFGGAGADRVVETVAELERVRAQVRG